MNYYNHASQEIELCSPLRNPCHMLHPSHSPSLKGNHYQDFRLIFTLGFFIVLSPKCEILDTVAWSCPYF